MKKHIKKSELQVAIEKLYEIISFPVGGEPDWSGIHDLFMPHARLTRITREARYDLDVKGFCAMAKELVEVGAMTSFYEFEVGRRVDAYGDVAHVLSYYVTQVDKESTDYLSRGLNSVQFIWHENRWRVVSLLWDERCENDDSLFEQFEAVENYYGSAYHSPTTTDAA